jgi:hypothetical protein
MLGFCPGRIASEICLQMLQVFSSRSDIQQIQDEVLVPVLPGRRGGAKGDVEVSGTCSVIAGMGKRKGVFRSEVESS